MTVSLEQQTGSPLSAFPLSRRVSPFGFQFTFRGPPYLVDSSVEIGAGLVFLLEGCRPEIHGSDRLRSDRTLFRPHTHEGSLSKVLACPVKVLAACRFR